VKFVFLDITNRQLASEETYIDVIKKEIREIAPKRLVIDSLVPLANIPASPEELIAYGLISNVSSFMPNIPQDLITRFQIHRLIMMLKDTKMTSLLISEIPKDSKWLSSDRVSEFMSDGVIIMHYLGIGSTSNRSLTIEKMRGTKHSEDVLPIEITKRGIKVNKSDKYDV
jgi:KaiC/GvpD/RAD55 family RecA-like ATPase